MTAEIACEVCVLGGGPAGSILAWRLSELGYDTLLVDRTGTNDRPRAESLAPSILPILDSLRLRDTVEAAVFRREKRALLRWGTNDVQVKDFDEAPALLVERTRLDDLLRKAAASAGARPVMSATARAPQCRQRGGWLVPVATSAGPVVIATKFLADARGRRPRSSVDDGAPRTAALAASFAPSDRAFTETRIEAGIDEWFWGSPLPDGRYAASIFLDAGRVAGLRGHVRMELFRRLLSRSKLLADLLRGELVGPISVRDATPRIGNDPIGHDFIRVGEAAVAIDPLSSQGIQAALLSSIQGSAAVHTILTAGCDPAPALEFYRERQQATAARSRQTAAGFYRAYHDQSPFWTRRSSPAENRAAEAEHRANTSPPSKLRISQALRITEVPVLSGALIRRTPALCHPRLKQPTAYLGGVALAPLVDEARDTSAADQILSRWTRRMPLETAQKIMSWMWAVGILDPLPDASRDHATSARR